MNPASNGTPGGAGRVQLGVDTIREFQVVTSNAKAELGRASGGYVNAVTRSGTNELHGSAFEFIRNDAWDARGFFDKELPPFKQNQFGGTLGGPLKKDKTFYFLGYEGLQSHLTEDFQRNVPTIAARQGTGFLTGTQKVDPRVLSYLDEYPLPPNGEDIGAGHGTYVERVFEPVAENYGSVRLDHNLSDKDVLFGRYTIDRSTKTQSNTFLSPFFLEVHNQYLTVEEDRIISPTVLNLLRLGYNRSFNHALPEDVPNATALSFGLGRPMGSLAIGSGFTTIGPNQISYNYQVSNAFQFDDQLTYTRGAHSMKFGVGLERFRWNSDQPNNFSGSYTFSSFANFLQAGPTGVNGSTLQPGAISYRHFRTWLPSFFAQDDYQVTPRLTLNLGFRWEFTTGFTENDNMISYLAKGPNDSVPDIAAIKSGAWVNSLATGDLIRGEGWTNHIKLFEPRFGFNWGLDKSGKTALSGGFGIFHSEILHNNMIAERFQLPQLNRGSFTNRNVTATFPNIYNAIAAFDDGTFSNTESRHFDHDNFKSPTFYRYNLTFQRELPGALALRVGYVGATGFHNARNQQLNRFPMPIIQNGTWFFPCGPSAGAPLTPTATCPNPVNQFINPYFGSIPFQGSDSNTVYNGLAVSLQKRFNKGLSFQVSYTKSKSEDDISVSESNFDGAGRTGQFAWDRSMDRARSTFNVPQVFVFNSLYELPVGEGRHWMNTGGIANAVLGGWQVGGILTWQTGTPFTVDCGSCTFPGYTFSTSRPNLVPGVDLNSLVKGVPADVKGKGGVSSRYFDPGTAFTQPAAGTLGSSPRSTLIGPPLKNVNFTLSKSYSAGERMKFQLRGEFFNFFNHTNFGSPSSSVFSDNAGTIDPTVGRLTTIRGTARQIQFGLKLTF